MKEPSKELAMAIEDSKKWAAESGNKHWILNLGGGIFGVTELRPDEEALRADGYELEAEVFPGGRVVWFGGMA